MVRAFASHQCGPGSIPAQCHMSVEFVVGSRPILRVFLWVLWFSFLQKNPTSLKSNSPRIRVPSLNIVIYLLSFNSEIKILSKILYFVRGPRCCCCCCCLCTSATMTTTNVTEQVPESESAGYWISHDPKLVAVIDYFKIQLYSSFFPGKCKDIFKSNCKYFASHDGYCTHWMSFMKKYCPYSCGFCKTAAPGEMAGNV